MQGEMQARCKSEITHVERRGRQGVFRGTAAARTSGEMATLPSLPMYSPSATTASTPEHSKNSAEKKVR